MPNPADASLKDASGARAFPITAERLKSLANVENLPEGLPAAVAWRDGQVRLLDQSRLPEAVVFIESADVDEIADAIRTMRVRGAPAIGIAAAYALAAAAEHGPESMTALRAHLDAAAAQLRATRPTAVNLAWAITRTLRAGAGADTTAELRSRLYQEARAIHEEDVSANRTIGALGAPLLPAEGGVLTHCNAGALATGGYGTALGVVRAAREAGQRHTIFIGESRPLLQGARLTTWELMVDGFDVRLVSDAAVASLFAAGRIGAVVVGSDRIAANGDVANKIGTYGLAVLAQAHEVPFYVAAPWSSVDVASASGAAIPIEQRDPAEVTELCGIAIAPAGVRAENPAFDITPSRLVSAIVTERGVHRAPYGPALRAAEKGEAVRV